MPLFFFAAGWVYKEKPILVDIKRRFQTVIVPYFVLGSLVLIYWQFIEKRFRDTSTSFRDALLGLLSGEHDNLEFNSHLWFLPCFFVTVVLFNILVYIGRRLNCGRAIAYAVAALMSLIYILLPVPNLLWGFERTFQYFGFYALGTLCATQASWMSEKLLTKPVMLVPVVALLAINFVLSLYGLTTGIMWFVTAIIGTAAIVILSLMIHHNSVLEYLGRITLVILCVHGPIYRVLVKLVSVPLHMSTDAVRENILLALVVVAITLLICSAIYEIISRFFPFIIGKKRQQSI